MRRFVLGDLHGAHKALLQCLERANFNYEEDELVCLGDVADGWPKVKECFDELLKIKHLIFILGNHDEWLLEWALGNHPGGIWTDQGGKATFLSYGGIPNLIPSEHINLLKNANYYFVDEDNRLFVHGGIRPYQELIEQEKDVFLWDRSLVEHACMIKKSKQDKNQITKFKEVFVGHTSTTHLNARYFRKTAFPKIVLPQEIYAEQEAMKPLNSCEIWMLDTGAGWEGKLTLMNIETKEYFQSDVVSDLYPGEKGRR